eukprot:331392-Chlamydomonas_euryale.AAC.3
MATIDTCGGGRKRTAMGCPRGRPRGPRHGCPKRGGKAAPVPSESQQPGQKHVHMDGLPAAADEGWQW